MTTPSASEPAPLSGTTLILAGVVLAMTNFMVVLDTTIANVSVAHIAGGLGISSSEGTWVITSYAVAEAICVPLTGWLSKRFGTVRVFAAGMLGFGIFSMLCGMAASLGALVAFRIGQGICGGPLMALSQTLLLRVFPKEKHAMTMGIWAMTTLTAPIFGPILGGTISDNWGVALDLLHQPAGRHRLLTRRLGRVAPIRDGAGQGQDRWHRSCPTDIVGRRVAADAGSGPGA